MGTDEPKIRCFGYYSQQPTCGRCPVSKRCKAVLITHGFDIVAALLEQMMDDMPDQRYWGGKSTTATMDQLIAPPNDVDERREELDDLLNLVDESDPTLGAELRERSGSVSKGKRYVEYKNAWTGKGRIVNVEPDDLEL